MRIFRIFIAVIFIALGFTFMSVRCSSGQPLMAVMNDGTYLGFEYCWLNKEKIKFNVPGGTASIQIKDVRSLEEIIKHEELDIEGMKKMAIVTESFDPLNFLIKYAKTTSGLTVEFSDKLPEPQKIAMTNNFALIGPIVKVYLSAKKIIQVGTKKPSLLIAVFFNAREPINPKNCYVQLFDMDEKPAEKFNSIVKFVSVPIKQRIKKKITRYSYVAYALIPLNREDYLAYDVRLTRFFWEHPQTEEPNNPLVLKN